MHAVYSTPCALGEDQMHVLSSIPYASRLSMYRTTMKQSYCCAEAHHKNKIKISYRNTTLRLHWPFPVRVYPGACQIGCARSCRGTAGIGGGTILAGSSG